MGLDTSHNCWHGSYRWFMNWRKAVCEAAGLGDLDDYIGFGGDGPFPSIKAEPLVALLGHSDCDGIIESKRCAGIAKRLEELLPKLREADKKHEEPWIETATRRWIDGLKLAAALGEDVDFH